MNIDENRTKREENVTGFSVFTSQNLSFRAPAGVKRTSNLDEKNVKIKTEQKKSSIQEIQLYKLLFPLKHLVPPRPGLAGHA